MDRYIMRKRAWRSESLGDTCTLFHLHHTLTIYALPPKPKRFFNLLHVTQKAPRGVRGREPLQ